MRTHDASDFSDPLQGLPLFTMASNITFSGAEIATYYAARVPSLKHRSSGELRGPCPIHDGENDNFAVDLKTGRWYCHSQCHRGGDILALEEALTHRDFPTCKAEVFRLVGRRPQPNRKGQRGSVHSNRNSKNGSSQRAATNSREPIPQPDLPVTADRARKGLAQDRFLGVATYQYGPNLRKVRFEHESRQQQEKNRPEKTFRWEHLKDGTWFSGDGGLPKPLYINKVFRERDQVEFAVGFEGEAKADLAGSMGLPAFSFKDTTRDQAPALVGCDVVLWPDNDQSGIEQAHRAAGVIAQSTQIRSIKIVTPPTELHVAGDIIDAVHGLGWDSARVAQFLETARAYGTAEPADPSKSAESAEPSAGDGLTQGQLLIELASKATLFHTPEGDAYACVPVGGHHEVWPVKSKSCRRWLTRAFFQSAGKPPGAQAMQDALGVLEARAQFDWPETQVFTRIAACGNNIYIDLCNDTWEVVEITSTGWKVLQACPLPAIEGNAATPASGPRRSDLEVAQPY